MTQFPFIFSNEPRYRIRRHVAFWTCWWLFSTAIYSFSAPAQMVPYWERLPLVAVESFLYLSAHMFLSYSLMYWAIPRYLLKGRYLQTVAVVVLLILAAALISALIGVYLINGLRRYLMGDNYLPPAHQYNFSIFLALLAGLRGGLTIGGMAAAIKLMKYWYVKEQRNHQLQKENAEAQLQLLKAQVHPHFLFNTLNNIYSFTQDSSPTGARMVMGLSDMLRYMLYDCRETLVPLQKELKLLQDYILLEEIRYNHHLDLNIELPDNTDELYIAPLILLPFVENCFKHGTSQVLEQPWVSLTISIEGRQLKMKLMNGKAESREESTGGIGIANVRKRLELLYPQRHQMKINNTDDTFIVNLWIDLDRIALVRESHKNLYTTHA